MEEMLPADMQDTIHSIEQRLSSYQDRIQRLEADQAIDHTVMIKLIRLCVVHDLLG